jgi:mannose-6-phosphate isomerase
LDVPEGIVAETWEISDQKETRATITNGPFAGRLLHDVVAEHPDEIVGTGWQGPHFPILDKFLDASHPLPVHLHADDETARRVYNEPNGKAEAWHILYAAPDASILAGIRPGFSDDDLRQAFLDEDYDRVMFRHPITAGDTIYVPGGILHAFGPDTLIFEVQQTSDLGQSVMPTDLYGNRHSPEQWRANIDATLAELKTHYLPKPHAGLDKPGAERGNRITVGGAGPHFAIERWRLTAPHLDAAHPWRFLTLSHTRAHLDRATLEGTAYGVRNNLETMVAMGALPQRLLAVGGGAKNRLWLQIVSDVTGVPQDVPERTIGASYGDAFLAGLGAGIIDSPDVLKREWVRLALQLEPNASLRPVYDAYYDVFRSMYESAKDELHALAKLGAASVP